VICNCVIEGWPTLPVFLRESWNLDFLSSTKPWHLKSPESTNSKMPLNLVFCGTPSFAVPTLEKLAQSGHQIHLVVTQPDRPKGRGLELVPSPVKQSALKLNLPITQPDKIRTNEEFRAQLTAMKPDAIIVVGYGRIIPQWMLELPPLGNINLHASLLPKYRGAAPIQWAIANGETVTGNTTMRIDAGLDTGDILLQQELTIAVDDTSETLARKLAEAGSDLMLDTLSGLQACTIHPRKQDNSKASLAPILKKEDGQVDFSRTAPEILNRLRGFQPWPGAYTIFRGKNLHILKAQPAPDKIPQADLKVIAGRLLAGCGQNTTLELLEVQLEGRKRTAARDFVHGYHPESGERLGQL
jgi:methionyl-tRNA formyltransferase